MNLTTLIISTVACISGYIYAFHLAKTDKWTHALVLLIVCGLLLRIFTSADPFLHTWDESYHALVAKNLLSHWLMPTLYEHPVLPYDYKNWTETHIWLHKQPLALWLISVSIRLFGIHAWAIRIPSLIFSTTAIKLIYDIAKHLKNNFVAFITAFLFSIQGLAIELAAGRVATDHIDTIFLFFILLSVWAAIKYFTKRSVYIIVFTGLSLGLAILTKWLSALIIVIPVWILLSTAHREKPMRIVLSTFFILFVATLIFLPWQLYIFHAFPKEATWENTYNNMHFSQALEGHNGRWYYYLDTLRVCYGELVYLPVTWFIYKTIKYRQPFDWVISVWFVIPYFFFSIAATKMPAYTIIAAPAVLMMCADLYKHLQNKVYQKNYLVSLIKWLLILLPVRYSIERIKPFNSHADKVEFKNINIQTHPIIVLNDPHPIETMFYNDCTSYQTMPDSLTISFFKKQGYEIIIY